jgi:hypothetical protein
VARAGLDQRRDDVNDRVIRAYERAEDDLAQQYNDGVISLAEFNAEMREMARDYAAEAEEAAQAAYDEERSRW